MSRGGGFHYILERVKMCFQINRLERWIIHAGDVVLKHPTLIYICIPFLNMVKYIKTLIYRDGDDICSKLELKTL